MDVKRFSVFHTWETRDLRRIEVDGWADRRTNGTGQKEERGTEGRLAKLILRMKYFALAKYNSEGNKTYLLAPLYITMAVPFSSEEHTSGPRDSAGTPVFVGIGLRTRHSHYGLSRQCFAVSLFTEEG